MALGGTGSGVGDRPAQPGDVALENFLHLGGGIDARFADEADLAVLVGSDWRIEGIGAALIVDSDDVAIWRDEPAVTGDFGEIGHWWFSCELRVEATACLVDWKLPRLEAIARRGCRWNVVAPDVFDELCLMPGRKAHGRVDPDSGYVGKRQNPGASDMIDFDVRGIGYAPDGISDVLARKRRAFAGIRRVVVCSLRDFAQDKVLASHICDFEEFAIGLIISPVCVKNVADFIRVDEFFEFCSSIGRLDQPRLAGFEKFHDALFAPCFVGIIAMFDGFALFAVIDLGGRFSLGACVDKCACIAMFVADFDCASGEKLRWAEFEHGY